MTRSRTRELLLEACFRCGMGGATEPVHSRQIFYVVHALLGRRATIGKTLQSALNTGCQDGLWCRDEGLYWFTDQGMRLAKERFGHLPALLPRVAPESCHVVLEGDLGGHEFRLDWIHGEWVVELNGDELPTATPAVELLAELLRDPQIAKKGQSAPERMYREGVKLGWELRWEGPRLPGELDSENAKPSAGSSESPPGPAEPPASSLAKRSSHEGAGFSSDPELRRRVELHAMKLALAWCAERFDRVVDVSADGVGYDIECWRSGERLAVEVKGTTTDGRTVELTRNEVETLRALHPATVLFLVSEVEAAEATVSGGRTTVFEPFDPDEHELVPITYRCQLRAGA